MKRKVRVFISTACLFAAYSVTNTNAQSMAIATSPYKGYLEIPSSGNTKNLMTSMSSINTFNQIFPNLAPAEKAVKGLGIYLARIESTGPAKKNLGMFKSIKMYVYISRPDGSNEVLLTTGTYITKKAGSTLDLDVNTGAGGKLINLDNINPSSTIEQAILGRVSGVEVLPSGAIRIRGISTTQAGASPLYIVNGIERGIQGLNPGDVESIEVLKDAGQLAMYGMRGANGVILIKTKSGNAVSGKKAGSLDNFVKGSTMRVRVEYLLRYPLRSETGFNIYIGFR